MSNLSIVHLPVVGFVEARVLRDGRLRLVLEVRQPSGAIVPLTVEGDARVPFPTDPGGRAALMPSLLVEFVPREEPQRVVLERPALRVVAA